MYPTVTFGYPMKTHFSDLGLCHGVDTADVLEQGLSRRAITLGILKGLIGTKDTRESFILVRPLTMKVKAYV